MAGLLELGFLTGMGGAQHANPVQTLEILKANRAQGQAQNSVGSVPQGSPFESQKVSMPQLSGIDTDSAMDMGAQRAERDAMSKPSEEKDLAGISPKVLNLASILGGGQHADRDNAMAQAGIGMAMAGGQTGNFLTALAAGANQGMDAYHKLRGERAERSMKEFQLNQTADYQRGTLSNQQEQTKIQGLSQAALQKYYEAQAEGVPAEIALRRAQAWAATQSGKLDAAKADSYSGGGSGIPADIWKRAFGQASKELSTVPMEGGPEAKAHAIQIQSLRYAANEMQQKGHSVWDMPVFAPIYGGGTPGATGAPGTETPAPKEGVPWAKYAGESTKGGPPPLLGNPAAFVPASSLKTVLANVSIGTYDPGEAFNMGKQQVDMLHSDLQNLDQIGGRPMKKSLEVIEKVIPKDGIFISPERNYDLLHGIYNDVFQKFEQDLYNVQNPTSVNKSVLGKSQERLRVEARILHRLAGDKGGTEYTRFVNPIDAPKKKDVSPTDDGRDLLEKYKD